MFLFGRLILYDIFILILENVMTFLQVVKFQLDFPHLLLFGYNLLFVEIIATLFFNNLDSRRKSLLILILITTFQSLLIRLNYLANLLLVKKYQRCSWLLGRAWYLPSKFSHFIIRLALGFEIIFDLYDRSWRFANLSLNLLHLFWYCFMEIHDLKLDKVINTIL